MAVEEGVEVVAAKDFRDVVAALLDFVFFVAVGFDDFSLYLSSSSSLSSLFTIMEPRLPRLPFPQQRVDEEGCSTETTALLCTFVKANEATLTTLEEPVIPPISNRATDSHIHDDIMLRVKS